MGSHRVRHDLTTEQQQQKPHFPDYFASRVLEIEFRQSDCDRWKGNGRCLSPSWSHSGKILATGLQV